MPSREFNLRSKIARAAAFPGAVLATPASGNRQDRAERSVQGAAYAPSVLRYLSATMTANFTEAAGRGSGR